MSKERGVLHISAFNEWESYSIEVSGKQMKLKELLDSISTLRLVYSRNYNLRKGVELFEFHSGRLTITIYGNQPSLDSTEFFLFMAKDYFSSISKTKITEKGESEVNMSKENQVSPISVEEFVDVLKSISSQSYSARVIIPCTNEFFNLRIKDDSNKFYVNVYRLDYNIHLPYPKMLSPYVSKEDSKGNIKLSIELNDKLYEWVYKNRYDETVTIDEIKELYEKFISKYKLSDLNKN